MEHKRRLFQLTSMLNFHLCWSVWGDLEFAVWVSRIPNSGRSQSMECRVSDGYNCATRLYNCAAVNVRTDLRLGAQQV